MLRTPVLARLAAALPAVLLLAACGGPDSGTLVTDLPEADAFTTDKALSTTAAPSQNFDLSHWKLTLPSGSEIKTAELAAGYTLKNVFYTDPHNGGMVFRCPNLAGTTANSSYSRTELREMLAPGSSASSDANNWTTADGGRMRARLRVNRVSTTGDDRKVGRVIIGQIHGVSTEVVRLYYDKKPDEARGRIYAASETVGGTTSWSPDIVTNMGGAGIALGQNFSYEIKLIDLKLTVIIIDPAGVRHTWSRTVDPGYAGENLYFKAGVYNQNNTGESSDYVQATFFRLEHVHPWPAS